jgi:hypothetical protein
MERSEKAKDERSDHPCKALHTTLRKQSSRKAGQEGRKKDKLEFRVESPRAGVGDTHPGANLV